MAEILTEAELSYLAEQPLGRLATVSPDGTPQVKPVGFRYDPDLGVIDIGGHNLAASTKFRNVAAGSQVALVVDDLVSRAPWRVRGLEIRGDAEALTDVSYRPDLPREVIRIHPRRIVSWGIEPGQAGMKGRSVS